VSTTLIVEQLVVDRLREWLLRKLPGRVTIVNAARAAVLKAPLVGPYTVPANAKLFHSSSDVESFTEVTPFTAGSRTAAQVAAEFNADVPGVASADSDGRLVFTAATAPSLGTDSMVALAAGPTNDAPDSNAAAMLQALGFDAGGERAVTTAIEAPGVKEVMDGMPMQPDSNGSRFWVVLGDNASVPDDPMRRDMYTVSVNVGLCVPVPSNSQHRNREHIRAALRAVRESLFIEEGGRTLGNADGIQLVTERQCVIRSRPTRFDELPNQLFGRANLELNVRVYERQGTS
jgi:hypothetical protein